MWLSSNSPSPGQYALQHFRFKQITDPERMVESHTTYHFIAFHIAGPSPFNLSHDDPDSHFDSWCIRQPRFSFNCGPNTISATISSSFKTKLYPRNGRKGGTLDETVTRSFWCSLCITCRHSSCVSSCASLSYLPTNDSYLNTGRLRRDAFGRCDRVVERVGVSV